MAFDELGIVVIDEQHRFGVKQRMAISDREGRIPDILVMSATPIPRSLAMALYGDLDLSLLDEMPPGRKPVTTSLRSTDHRTAVYEFVRSEIAMGRQAYIVYPLVDDSEKIDLLSAKREFERLSSEVFLQERVGLIHGQLASAEKDSVMREFIAGKIDILVATTAVSYTHLTLPTKA